MKKVLSKADQQWVDELERLYKQNLTVLQQMYDAEKKVYDSYTSETKEEYSCVLVTNGYEIVERVDRVNMVFVSAIYSYFQEKYSIDFKRNVRSPKNIPNEYSIFYHSKEMEPVILIITDVMVEKEDVINDIFSQLQGDSFEDRAIKIVKDKIKKSFYNASKDLWELKINGNKLTCCNTDCIKDCNPARTPQKYDFLSVGTLNILLEGLSYYFCGTKTRFNSIEKLYGYNDFVINEEDFKTPFLITEIGVEIKFFKNGRVDVRFPSAASCRKFVSEWIGYSY